MKKLIFSLAIMALAAIVPTASKAQFNENASLTNAHVVTGKLAMIKTQDVEIIPGAYIVLLQDLENPKVFYVATTLDDSLFINDICRKGTNIFTAQALEIDKAQTEIILRDYRNKLDQRITAMQKKVDELKVKPGKEKKADKNERKLQLKQALLDLAKLKKSKEDMIGEFKKLINLQSSATGFFRMIHTTNSYARKS
jgi:hypothetical protein